MPRVEPSYSLLGDKSTSSIRQILDPSKEGSFADCPELTLEEEEEVFEVMDLPSNLYGSFISAIGKCEKAVRDDTVVSLYNRRQDRLSLFAYALSPTVIGLILNYTIQFTFFSTMVRIMNNKLEEDPDCMTAQRFKDHKSDLFLAMHALTICGALKDWARGVRVVMVGTLRLSDGTSRRLELSRLSRALCTIFVIIPELFCFWSLLFYGSKYIMMSPNIETTLLNCSALSFISNCDEIIYEASVKDDHTRPERFEMYRGSRFGSTRSGIIDAVFAILHVMVVILWPGIFAGIVMNGQDPYDTRQAEDDVMEKSFKDNWLTSGTLFILFVVSCASLICLSCLLARAKASSPESLWGSWFWTRLCRFEREQVDGQCFCGAADDMMEKPWAAPVDILLEGQHGYGVYQKESAEPSTKTGCYSMTQQLRRPKGRSETAYMKPSDDYMLTFSRNKDGTVDWSLMRGNTELATAQVQDDGQIPSELKPLTNHIRGPVFMLADEKRLFKASVIQSMQRMLFIFVLCAATCVLLAITTVGTLNLWNNYFVSVKTLRVDPPFRPLGTSAGGLTELGPGAWRSQLGCPAGLEPCKLDGSICVDLGDVWNSAVTPIGSTYSRWCPIARSTENCTTLDWNEVGSSPGRSVAVPFCASPVNVSSALVSLHTSTLGAWLQTCRDVGARLCRPSELTAARQAGWSSEPCAANSYWLRRSNGSWTCTEALSHVGSELDASICCADRAVDAWPCAREPPGHTCSYAPCSEAIGPVHCIEDLFVQDGFMPMTRGYCRCDQAHCEFNGKCVLPTEHLLATQARYQLRRNSTGCRSDRFVGAFLSAEGCAAEVSRLNGSAFSFDDSIAAGRGSCFLEAAPGERGCPENSDEARFDYYALLGPPKGT